MTILYKPETSIYRRTQTHDFVGPSLEESPAWSCSTMMEEWPPWSCRETLYRANPYIKRKTQEKMPKNVLFVSLWTAADWSPPGPPGWSPPGPPGWSPRGPPGWSSPGPPRTLGHSPGKWPQTGPNDLHWPRWPRPLGGNGGRLHPPGLLVGWHHMEGSTWPLLKWIGAMLGHRLGMLWPLRAWPGEVLPGGIARIGSKPSGWALGTSSRWWLCLWWPLDRGPHGDKPSRGELEGSALVRQQWSCCLGCHGGGHPVAAGWRSLRRDGEYWGVVGLVACRLAGWRGLGPAVWLVMPGPAGVASLAGGVLFGAALGEAMVAALESAKKEELAKKGRLGKKAARFAALQLKVQDCRKIFEALYVSVCVCLCLYVCMCL